MPARAPVAAAAVMSFLSCAALADAEYGGGKLRVGLGEKRRHDLAHQDEMLGRRRRGGRHRGRTVEVEAGIVEHLFETVPGMQAFERKARALPVEGEDAAIGDEGNGPARP